MESGGNGLILVYNFQESLLENSQRRWGLVGK